MNISNKYSSTIWLQVIISITFDQHKEDAITLYLSSSRSFKLYFVEWKHKKNQDTQLRRPFTVTTFYLLI